MKRFIHTITLALLPLTLGIGSAPALASDRGTSYEVTITNLTRGEIFTPVMVATHQRGIKLFELGQPASEELAAIAEGGDTGPQTAALVATGKVADIKTGSGVIPPGASATIVIKSGKRARFISVAAMLVPTNDAFFSLNGVRLPTDHHVRNLYSPAYDAGSEPNDELCANIPGPCGGEGGSPNVNGEGYVHVHGGIHGIGDLSAADYDWRNPVAQIRIRRMP